MTEMKNGSLANLLKLNLIFHFSFASIVFEKTSAAFTLNPLFTQLSAT